AGPASGPDDREHAPALRASAHAVQTGALLNPATIVCTLQHKALSTRRTQMLTMCVAPASEAIMRKWLRRIRGAIGMGLTWGAAWSAVGSVPRWIFGINTDVPIPLVLGVLAFFAGVIFSTFLALIEGRRRFDQMSLRRFAA